MVDTNDTYDPIMIDILISDVQSNDLHEKISEDLHIKYLADSAKDLNDVRGILYGDCQRLIGAMTLDINGKLKNIHFLVNTGSPKTDICKENLSYPLLIRTNLFQLS